MARARSPQAVKCTRCGRGNPDHVRYCLDCGNDLTLQASSAFEAASGAVGAHASAAVADKASVAIADKASASVEPPIGAHPSEHPLTSRRTISGRPPAPELQFAARQDQEASLVRSLASLEAPPPLLQTATKVPVCSACGSPNPSESAFCTECGKPLPGLKGPRALGSTVVAPGGNGDAALAGPLQPSAGARRPSDEVPITERHFGAVDSPSRVPQPDAPPKALPPFQTCSRCEGMNSQEARFCQLCGVPLATNQPAAGPPSPSPGAAHGRGQIVEPLTNAWLVVISQDGTPGRRYPLRTSEVAIGREKGDILLEKDPYVCPTHARVTYGSRGFAIEDLDSVNRVYVRIGSGPVELKHGDLLLLGQGVLRFEIVEETERSISPAIYDSTRIFGTPAIPRRARLVVHTVEGCGRDIFYLSRPETILGREAGDIVFTDDPFMSRRHAALRRASATNTYTLRDLGSSNGTFIAIRTQQHLSPGDHIRIGQHLFRLDVQSGGQS